jgi:hypothetical protein
MAVVFLWLVAWCAGASPRASTNPSEAVWQVPVSTNPMPHFEKVNGRERLFVDGRLFTALGAEIPWWGLIYGHYDQDLGVYDYLYPAAEALGLNVLKVPVKWSMVEPKKGIYDFSYVDHARSMAQKYHLKLVLDWFGHYASGPGTIYENLTGEMYAPYYIISDEKDYPRAVDADGVPHHNTVSYDYPAVIQQEVAAFRSFLAHIKQVDSQTHTIIMIQVENEIAVFGADRHNRKLWRDHSPASNKLFREKGFADDLKYSAWDLSYNWIRPLTDAGAAVYPLPFFHNYVGGKLEDGIVGGAPGEDVATYLENCPHIAFIGLNMYVPGDSSADYLRHRLEDYRVSRNLPAITETNSGADPVAPRLAFIAVGEFGSPIFAPWALNVSYPADYQPYVLRDGSLANGAFALRDAYTALRMALPQVSFYAETGKEKVFMADVPGQKFSETRDVNGFSVTVSGEDNGEAIVIHPSGHEFLLIGYRCGVSFHSTAFVWPAIQKLRVESGSFDGDEWKAQGAPSYGIDQSHQTLSIELDRPEVIRVSW